MSALALGAGGGIPDGVINILPSTRAHEIGLVLTTHPLVRKVSFTGSTAVGRTIMRQSSGTIKKLSLELGGNAPFIVFDDADLNAAVTGAIASKFRNSGQTCVCANCFYVQAGIYDSFAEKFAKAAIALKIGPPFEPGVEQGPLITSKALAKVEEVVGDALAKGCPGRRCPPSSRRHFLRTNGSGRCSGRCAPLARRDFRAGGNIDD
jgi:succinate-semialdehyde dehydrogenase / glutarate-semialdehyde dehydrogenase